MELPNNDESSSSARLKIKLQGPKPTPLKVGQESHKIKKPARPPPPVIIYTVSPKVIHTSPSEFMSLVQRLTGPDSCNPILTPPSATELALPLRPIAQKLCPDQTPFINIYQDQPNCDEEELFTCIHDYGQVFEHNYDDDFDGGGGSDSPFGCPLLSPASLEFLSELLYP